VRCAECSCRCRCEGACGRKIRCKFCLCERVCFVFRFGVSCLAFQSLPTFCYIHPDREIPSTYDHRLKKIGHPVRSAILKLQIGGLVVGWVTTSEYPLLYVIFVLCGPLSLFSHFAHACYCNLDDTPSWQQISSSVLFLFCMCVRYVSLHPAFSS
jgi:hypothetical protein